MKQVLVAGALLAGMISAASAADVYTPDSLKDTFTEDRNTVYFQGLGIGIDGGGQFNAIQLNGGSASFDGISADGLIGGGHIEYLFGTDRYRFGGFCGGGFSNVNTDIETPGPSGDLLNMDHYYGCYAKAGSTIYDSTLLAVHFGYEWQKWSVGDAFNADLEADAGYWVGGASIETMATDHWSLGLIVDYGFLDKVDVNGTDLTPIFDESEFGRARVSLTRRF